MAPNEQDELLQKFREANSQGNELLKLQITHLDEAFKDFRGAINSKIGGVENMAREIVGAVGEIKESVIILKEQRPLEEIAKLRTVCDKQEERIRALENWRWYVIGVMTVLAAAAGFVGAAVSRVVVK